MKKIAGVILTGVLLTVVGCSNNASMQETTVKETVASSVETSEKAGETMKESEEAKKDSYTHIDQETAKQMMANEDGHIIVDVRSKDEYASGHIPGAICIPNESITNTQPEELPDLDQVILVYCRSGNRSRQASQKLYDMGYTNVYEFGGIKDWTGETVAGN
jgi:rhodanese domain-containing protein